MSYHETHKTHENKKASSNAALYALLTALMGFVLFGFGAMGAVVVYETQPEATQPAAQIIEQPVYMDRVVTVIVTETVIIQATAMPLALEMPLQASEAAMEYPAPPTASPEPEKCTNIAWVISQPISDMQGSAIEIGRIKRLHFVIGNEGTCPWDGYVLTSAGVLPDIPIPFTPPGGVADFSVDMRVSRSLIARFALMTAGGDLFGVLNTTSPDMIIYYRLDVYRGKNVIQVPEALGGGTITCTGAG